ncbi:MAG TPA: phosphatase PAP2 family protein [Clostridia bacterium]|nr:phosphatase PAP2 family protein [Clostridia bacterium]
MSYKNEDISTQTTDGASTLNNPISTNMKTLFAAIWFVLIFGTLLTLASFFDLSVSKILTANSLPSGEYYSTSQFGLFFETMGSAPIWIMGALAVVIFFWNAVRLNKKSLRIVLGILLSIITVAVLYFFFADLFKYILEKVDAKEYADETYIMALKVMLAAAFGAMLIMLWKNVKPETNRILFKWAIVIICVAAFYLLISILKGPIGRVRFRTMNATGDNFAFVNFTDWWVINGKRTVSGLPSDSCKSFPSGHTFSAGLIYTLICLPHLLPAWNKKSIKIWVWIVAIAYTGTVAISRIVVGAHYFSDVLFGGTIAFLATILFREIFVDKCKHFIALKDLSFARKGRKFAPTEEEAIESEEFAMAEKAEAKQAKKNAK